MFRKLHIGFLFLAVVLAPCRKVSAQDDAGLWTSVTLKHRITRQLTASLSEQLRLYQNVSEIEQFFTDAGLEYDLSKSVKISLNYRFASKNKFTYYSSRHRVYADISLRHKIKPVIFTLRQRIQEQVEEINSSERGKIPEWYSRTKLSVKYDLDKKYRPYLAFEMFYLIDDAKEKTRQIDKLRYEGGFDYEFNRRHSLNIFYMIQQEVINNKLRDFIAGVGYTCTF